MAGELASALKEFTLALDELASSFEFVRTATRLRPRLNDMLRWDGMDDNAKALAGEFLRQGIAHESLLYRGMVVSLAGAFEHFVRRIMRDTVLTINRSRLQYDSLHEHLRKQNIYRTGIALQTIFEPPDYLALDYEILSKNIGTCFTGSKSPVLNAEAFTLFLSLIAPEKLAKTLECLGVKFQWDALGARQPLQDFTEKKNTRDTAKALQDYLKRFGQIRNRIAHSGMGGIVVTETDFDQFLSFFRMFGASLVSVIEAELSRLHKK